MFYIILKQVFPQFLKGPLMCSALLANHFSCFFLELFLEA